MIHCAQCGKENQDHYKFCLGCGVELTAPEPAPEHSPSAEPELAPVVREPSGNWTGTGPRDGAASHLDDGALFASAAAATLEAPPGQRINTPLPPPAPAPDFRDTLDDPPPPEPFDLKSRAPARGVPVFDPPVDPTGATAPPAPPPARSPSRNTCPSCGNEVAPGFLFCGSCGARVGTIPAPSSLAAQGASGGRAASTPAPVRVAAAQSRGRLVLIRSDGTEGGTHGLLDGTNLVGRGAGPLFDGDAFLSPRHAEIVFGSGAPLVRDLRSLNGVFVKIAQEEEIVSGSIFRIGQELLRFDAIPPPMPLEDGTEIMGSPNPGFWGRLTVIVGRDTDGSAFPLFGDGVVLGRERGDILFPEDGYVSGTHARISFRDGRFYLADLGSSNGTFLRLRAERPLKPGTFLLMGQQLFKLAY